MNKPSHEFQGTPANNPGYDEDVSTEGRPIDPVSSLPDMASIDEKQLRSHAWYQLDETSTPLLASMQPSMRSKCLETGMLPGPRRYDLGRFAIDDMRSVVFEAIPQLNYAGYSEVWEIPPGTSESQEREMLEKSEEDVPVLERFLQLASKNDPIPRMLIELDEDIDDESQIKGLKGREIVDTLDPLVGSLDELAVAAPPPVAAEPGAVEVCFVGGLNVFKDTYCQNKGISYCDNGATFGNETQLVRSSGSSRKKRSHTRVASCFETTVVNHLYRGWWFGWKWFFVTYPNTGGTQQFVPSHWKKYWRHKGLVKRRRKVHVTKTSSDGYFRAWSAFYNS
ncbi:MAG: hypothetical protein AAFW74_02520 [Pseudomonadota bacterium]